MRAIPERLRDVSCIGAKQIDITCKLFAATFANVEDFDLIFAPK